MSHFLLELIQNADDSEYTGANPAVALTLTASRLQIDSNERGFSKQDVEAICRLGRSTKAGNAKARGYVGEKGIGFKAVFEVADEVFISSGHYCFKFDKRRPLGMVNPAWCDKFPGSMQASGTSILLLLRESCAGRIERDMKALDSRTLMFLRRLRRIDVRISGMWKSSTTLTRQDLSPSITILAENAKETRYFVWRHVAKNLPTEDKRLDIKESEVVLAFPFAMKDSRREPKIEAQDIYAFLPIRRCGLPVGRGVITFAT